MFSHVSSVGEWLYLTFCPLHGPGQFPTMLKSVWASVAEYGSISPQWHHTDCGYRGRPTSNNKTWLKKYYAGVFHLKQNGKNFIYNSSQLTVPLIWWQTNIDSSPGHLLNSLSSMKGGCDILYYSRLMRMGIRLMVILKCQIAIFIYDP